MTILVTRPESDTAVFYLSKWCEKVIIESKNKGCEVIDLNKANASKAKLESVIYKKKPNLIILNGHGGENLVSGHNNEILVMADDNESLLKSTITYAISCKSAKKLGPKAVEKGALSYLGYVDDFIFVYNKNRTATPLKDDLAGQFIEPSNELIRALIKGNTSLEAYNRSQDNFKKNIHKMLTSESLPGSENHVRFLFWNMKNQAVLGDKESSIKPR